MRQAGMTLVEVLAVVVILGLIAGAVVVNVSGSVGEAKHQLAKTQIAHLKGKVETYYLKKSTYPTASNWQSELSGSAQSVWYTERSKFKDPWGNDFLLLVPGPNSQPFEIKTYGADAMSGGEGENADVSSAQLED